YAVEIERWVGESEHGGTYHRGVFGLAAGHDHVDGENLAGQRAPAWRDLALDEGWVAAQRRNDGVDLVLRRRDDGQTVGPAALEIEFHQVHVGDVTRQRLGERRRNGHLRPPPKRCPSAIRRYLENRCNNNIISTIIPNCASISFCAPDLFDNGGKPSRRWGQLPVAQPDQSDVAAQTRLRQHEDRE